MLGLEGVGAWFRGCGCLVERVGGWVFGLEGVGAWLRGWVGVWFRGCGCLV